MPIAWKEIENTERLISAILVWHEESGAKVSPTHNYETRKCTDSSRSIVNALLPSLDLEPPTTPSNVICAASKQNLMSSKPTLPTAQMKNLLLLHELASRRQKAVRLVVVHLFLPYFCISLAN